MISAKLQRLNILFLGIERKNQNEGSIIDLPLSQAMGKRVMGLLNKLEISFHFNIIYTLVFTTSLRCT